MNDSMKLILAVAVTAVVCIAGTYVAVGMGDKDDGITISAAGSTTVQPLMVSFQEVYEKNTGVTLEVSGGGSGAGASAAINGTADIGMLSRDLKTSETSAGLKETVIAKDGVAVVVGSGVADTVTNLTKAQIQGIFSGTITNWDQVGGPSNPISVVVREEGSGTRDCFQEYLGSSTVVTTNAQVVSSNGAMVTTLNANAYVVGYISLGYLPQLTSAKAVMADGVVPSDANVINGTYLIKRNLILATKGDATGPVQTFFAWILSPAGQKIVLDNGYIPIGPTS